MHLGEYIIWAPDDGIFISDGLKICLDELRIMSDYKNVIILRYKEEERDGLGLTEAHYKCGFHEPLRSLYVDPNFWIFNCGMMTTRYWNEIGGFDCQFEGTAMAHADLGIRLQKDGCKVKFLNFVLLNCSHLPRSIR